MGSQVPFGTNTGTDPAQIGYNGSGSRSVATFEGPGSILNFGKPTALAVLTMGLAGVFCFLQSLCQRPESNARQTNHDCYSN